MINLKPLKQLIEFKQFSSELILNKPKLAPYSPF